MANFQRLQLCLLLLAAACVAPAAAKGAARMPEHAAFTLVKPATLQEFRALMAAEPDDVVAARDNAQHSPLNMAAFHGNPEAVELLLAAGADASNPDTSGHTPLHHAVISATNSPDTAARIIDALVKAGAKTEAQDGKGCTPMQWTHMQAGKSPSSAAAAQRLTAGGAKSSPAMENWFKYKSPKKGKGWRCPT